MNKTTSKYRPKKAIQKANYSKIKSKVSCQNRLYNKQSSDQSAQQVHKSIQQLMAKVQSKRIFQVQSIKKTRNGYRNYSSTPYFSSKQMRKTLRHEKSNFLKPYQKAAENESSDLYNWKGNAKTRQFGMRRSQSSLRSFRTQASYQNTPVKQSRPNSKQSKTKREKHKIYSTNQVQESPAKNLQSSLYQSFISQSNRFVYEPHYSQNKIKKFDISNQLKLECDALHKRILLFHKLVLEQRQSSKFITEHIKNLKRNIIQEKRKTEKSCGEAIMVEREIDIVDAQIMAAREVACLQEKQIQMEYEETFEQSEQNSQLKEQVKQTKLLVEENQKAIQFYQKERLNLQVQLRYIQIMKKEDKHKTNMTMKKLGYTMKNYTVNTALRTDFKHELIKTNLTNPENECQLLDHTDIYHNLHGPVSGKTIKEKHQKPITEPIKYQFSDDSQPGQLQNTFINQQINQQS